MLCTPTVEYAGCAKSNAWQSKMDAGRAYVILGELIPNPNGNREHELHESAVVASEPDKLVTTDAINVQPLASPAWKRKSASSFSQGKSC